MTKEYPVYAKLSDQKLSQLGIDDLENLEIEDSPVGYRYIDPAWDYTTIYKLLVYVSSRIQGVILAISRVKNATPKSNLELDNHLSQLIDYLQSIRERLK